MDEGSLHLVPYDRLAAVRYAHRWAYGRNPAFYDYEKIGGDCTNFASQCVYAGSGIMNYTKDLGWYYIDANNKAPAWTGVEYFYQFMTRGADAVHGADAVRKETTVGPVAQEASISQMEPGDVIQLSFDGERWNHSPVVVQVLHRNAIQPSDVLIAAHSYDADNRPLSSYNYRAIRFLHFVGVRKPVR